MYTIRFWAWDNWALGRIAQGEILAHVEDAEALSECQAGDVPVIVPFNPPRVTTVKVSSPEAS